MDIGDAVIIQNHNIISNGKFGWIIKINENDCFGYKYLVSHKFDSNCWYKEEHMRLPYDNE